MAKDPAFLFYSADFLIGTSFFSREEVGDYIRILCHLHQVGGHMASQDIRQVAPEVSEKVLKKFKITDSGLFFNDRLLTEMQRRKAFTESRLNNLQGSHKGSHMAPHMENETDTDNKDINIKNKKARFVKPTITELRETFEKRGYPASEGDKFLAYFESVGWVVGSSKKPMKSWPAAITTWCVKLRDAGIRPKQISPSVVPKKEETGKQLSNEEREDLIESALPGYKKRTAKA